MTIQRPTNREEFIKFVKNIDSSLRDRGVPIPARPIQAAGEACERAQDYVAILPCKEVPDPDKFSGQDLIAHVYKWYEDTYGDRLKVDFSPGSMAILIRGDPWLVKFPLLFGRFMAVCGPDRIPASRAPAGSGLIDVLSLINGLTPSLRASLTPQECREIARSFQLGLDAVQTLQNIRRHDYGREAIGDQKSAVESIFARPPQYGPSRWHSLQLTEKTIKCCLVAHGRKARKTHNIAELLKLAEPEGLTITPGKLIAEVQCSPDVRYGELTSTLVETIRAHHASLEICRQVIKHMGI